MSPSALLASESFFNRPQRRSAVDRSIAKTLEDSDDVQNVRTQCVSPFDPEITSKEKPLSQTRYSSPFRERVRDALRRRLHPKTNLRANVLAYAIQVSEATIWNLYGASSEPSGRVLDKLVEFFGAQFLQEVFGGPGVHCFDPRDARKADALKRIADAQEELRRLG